MADARQIKIKLIKSLIGRPEKHQRVIKALGLYKTNQEVSHAETPVILGMLHKISHLVEVEAA